MATPDGKGVPDPAYADLERAADSDSWFGSTVKRELESYSGDEIEPVVDDEPVLFEVEDTWERTETEGAGRSYFFVSPAYPGAEKKEQNPTIKVAYISGLLALVAALITVGGNFGVEAFKGSSAPADCGRYISDLRDRSARDPGFIDAVTVTGTTGKPLIDSDTTASSCHIDAATLRKIVQR